MIAHTSGLLDAARLEAVACRAQEPPEPLHLHHALDGEPNGLGVGLRPQGATSLTDSRGVDEEGLSGEPGRPGDALLHRHMVRPLEAYLIHRHKRALMPQCDSTLILLTV